MIELSRDGDIHIITLNDGLNMVQPEFVKEMHAALDRVEAESEGPSGLVIVGRGKYFSTGLDVDIVMKLQGDEQIQFGLAINSLIRRILLSPVPTVAALNGHAFAAGAVIALACDYRVMREDRGWICFSEVDVGVPIGEPMMKLVRAKLTPTTAREAILVGKRFDASEAIASGFADDKAPEQDLLSTAIKLASSIAGKERRIFKNLKKTLWSDVAAALEPKH